MDLKHYRASESEQKRTQDLMRLISLLPKGKSVLDIGARDGHFSILLTEYYENVTALDLEKPSIAHPEIHCVQGDITQLNFGNNVFDLVFCAEVLEHIPSHLLQKACTEVGRVSNEYLLIGVPYQQDIRVGRTTCYSCGKRIRPGDTSIVSIPINCSACFLHLTCMKYRSSEKPIYGPTSFPRF